MIIKGNSDIFQLATGPAKALGPNWLESSSWYWQQAVNFPEREVILDLSDIEFVTVFDWLTVMALIERVLSSPQVLSFKIDLVGDSGAKVIPAKEYLGFLNGKKLDLDYTRVDLDVSDRVYTVAGFLEALGTLDVLSVGAERANKLIYTKILAGDVSLRSFHTHRKARLSGKDDSYTVVLDTTRVKTKNDCRQFLNADHILNWREAMGRRFQDSPLFESEEVWRVLCHELAVNIYEHAGVVGFIAARVVQEPLVNGIPKLWSFATYGATLDTVYEKMGNGFLELCVTDAGQGFLQTLTEAYIAKAKIAQDRINPEELLSFAFDELSTRKAMNQCWATERHALGRILQIVAKYGGALLLRSGGAEVIYRTTGGKFKQITNHLGYEPQSKRRYDYALPGAQLQLILPLVPLTDITRPREPRSVLDVSLPESFRPQPDQVRGHLIPLRDELESTKASIGGPEQQEFWEACENLGRKLIGRAPTEVLVLDFSDLNWTAEQFETLLHLLQNLLQNRPVLLVEIDPLLAREVDELERQAAPTQLKERALESGRNKDGVPYEISETRYLETFSRVHSPVLGLDQDGRRYLFGILAPQYKDPLLSLIDTPKSIKDLCSEKHDGVYLKEGHLLAILNNVNYLFEVSPEEKTEELWRTTWSSQALANEASRVISSHFDAVAERCQAWRGRTGDLSDD